MDSYLVLLRVGFTIATVVTNRAVRSYRTFSPLLINRETDQRYPFCCTFRGLTPPRRYLAPCPMEPGLSSPAQPEDCPAAIAQPARGPCYDYMNIQSSFLRLQKKAAEAAFSDNPTP